ncbi:MULTISPECIES: glycerophosphodiester phosphodiesterase family protein [unclassified Streptomyces]|uniref:glycerophosphodiester phosphodiesterase family protein n=1 Tax=unclassified Streptomyces TaxID=2593676 RepID=UPI002DDAFD01|nr:MULTISPECIES: glycerophosphodiester phosphodiesterase family protein [unclassified Streptomyces]WSC34682.1 glycerophosphodiester phosphodiesterase family protein [Streptomyces sp. NBC_01763]WSC43090.1 glycerophosphodiester phosphodiesterase family protein [Streptomyces sp. NBC_01762]WSD22627.1 glycerophosphodiester phosphodiesterase family protein [Streptomyces sp. NBC_01751]WSJ55359.1 glycerophosphodiester phosphodiesterase family protein [Streptomyces sp. NBC_01318]
MSLRHAVASLAVLPVLAVPATAQAATAHQNHHVPPQKTHFDLQAHRGGLGLTTEESLEGFGKALRLGVSTLELDTHITKDQKVVVNHDRQISAQKCKDTGPVTPGDPMYPYVGKYIKDLTLAQIKSMDCGYQQLPGFPEQEQIKGFRMVELKDVLNLVKSYKAKQVKLNIETKVEAGAPEQTAPRELFVRRVFEEIHRSGIEKQVTIQSFDWGALKEMHKLAPSYPLVALTNYDFLQVGKDGASPWLGGIDADDYDGDFVKAAAAVPGVTALSPNYGFPQNGTIADPAFRFYPDKKMISEAHERGLKVIPWTCDDPATIEALMDMGIDGIITDYPNRVRDIMADRGMRLPKAYPAPRH